MVGESAGMVRISWEGSEENLRRWVLKTVLFLVVMVLLNGVDFGEEVMERVVVLVAEVFLTAFLETVFLMDLVAGATRLEVGALCMVLLWEEVGQVKGSNERG
jgi:hypothetical protein